MATKGRYGYGSRIALALKNYLITHIGHKATEMPTDVYVSNGKIAQEWDAAFKADGVLYLCEAKHIMSSDKIPKIVDRIQIFKEKFKQEYSNDIS